jgi:hypothetical protein
VELQLPLPRFLARAGRAAAARGSKKRISDAAGQLRRKEQQLESAEQAWAAAESLRAGMDAVERAERARPQQVAAEGQLNAAWQQEERRRMHVRLLDEEAEARARKREADRLRRRGLSLAARQDAEALASVERGVRAPGAGRSAALTRAAEQRARAGATREAAELWAAEAREQEQTAVARRRAALEQRASLRRLEEEQARARGGRKKENPIQQATGAGNAGFSAPSLLAHLPFPGTVEIQVSWSQITETWSGALAGAAAAALKHYVGFIVGGVLAPGKGKIAAILLDLVKSGINDTLIDGAAKFITAGTWPIKLSTKLGPVKVSLQCEPDPAAGGYKWQGSLESTEAGGPLLQPLAPKLSVEGGSSRPAKVSLNVAGMPALEKAMARFPIDYASGVPAVN